MQKSLKKNCNWPLTLFILHISINSVTGKSLSEAPILASTNPQYDVRLFIELRVQFIKITMSEHVVYKNCFFMLRTIYVRCTKIGHGPTLRYTTFS